MMNMPPKIVEFIIKVLDDDLGISEDAYRILIELYGMDEEIDSIIADIDAADGRYFLLSE